MRLFECVWVCASPYCVIIGTKLIYDSFSSCLNGGWVMGTATHTHLLIVLCVFWMIHIFSVLLLSSAGCLFWWSGFNCSHTCNLTDGASVFLSWQRHGPVKFPLQTCLAMLSLTWVYHIRRVKLRLKLICAHLTGQSVQSASFICFCCLLACNRQWLAQCLELC